MQPLQVRTLTFFVFLFFAVTSVHGMTPANPGVIVASQPDGQNIELRFKGDAVLSWYEDMEGFPVRYTDDGRYVYQLSLESDDSSTLEVGKVDPVAAGVPKFTPMQRAAANLRELSSEETATLEFFNQSSGPQSVITSGTLKNLVLLIRFSDHKNRPLPTKEDFEVLFNAIGGDPQVAPTGSIRDIYQENSYGQLTIESTVVGWLDLPQTESYYANGVNGFSRRTWEAIRGGLDAADDEIDFSQFDIDGDEYIDAITFVHSGFAAEFGQVDEYGAPTDDRIWSHKWAISPEWQSDEGVRVFNYNINPGVWGIFGSAIGRVGVIAHELGHFLGLPDLYSRAGTGEGIGSWGLMANSWGFSGTQWNPPHMSSWSKDQLGWIEPEIISAEGTYSIDQTSESAETYKVEQGFPDGEYLLIENRQPIGIEATMPQGGLVVFHIDNNKSTLSPTGIPGQSDWPADHYMVAVKQADNFYDLERDVNRGDGTDPYHAGANASLTPETSPSTDAYQTGQFVPTGVEIFNVSSSGSTMTFDFKTLPSPCDADGASPTFTLSRNTWEMITLPCAPEAGSTIADVLGDDIPGVYGINGDWVMFQYDPVGAQYSVPLINDAMEIGTGYWLIQDVVAEVIIDLPQGSTQPATTISAGEACLSSLGCFDRPLSGAPFPVNPVDPPVPAYWSIVGHPFDDMVSFDDLRVSTVSGTCSDDDGCTMAQAREEFQVFNTIWNYNSSTGAYDAVSNGGFLAPWRGYWVAEMSGTGGIAPTLHIPKNMAP